MGNILTNSCIDRSRKQKIDEVNEQWLERILKQECIHWDNKQRRFVTSKFFIIKTNNKIQYISDNGQIMRIDRIIDQLNQHEILTNLEQINYLNWIGQYGDNRNKVGRWVASWQGQALIGIGGVYSNDGKKQGQWHCLFKNYSGQVSVYECGEYYNNQKIGKWKYILGFDEIGGGSYDNDRKIGKWIELSKNFSKHIQITYNGEYKNGKKVGIWDIYYRKNNSKRFQLIGGGSYDAKEGKDTIKIGKWIELSDGFSNKNEVIYKGVYSYGVKVGKWETKWRMSRKDRFQYIGGGSYDDMQQVDTHIDIKQGRWLELNDLFQESNQVIYSGEYKNGIKVGRWDTYWKETKNQSFKLIGGGQYHYENLEGQYNVGTKLGIWVELSDGFRMLNQITWKGEYQNNKKVGRWKVRFEWKDIGGGSYDDKHLENGQSVKVGKWIELSDKFDKENQVIYKGVYKYGKRVCNWDVLYRQSNYQPFEYIGGGSYDYYQEEGVNDIIYYGTLKTGKWIELTDEFQIQNQILQQGEYRNGKKIGRWDILYRNNIDKKFEQIGGGSYDYYQEVGVNDDIYYGVIKTGKWIELSNEFEFQNQILYYGEYKQGQKVGRWDILHRNKNNLIFELIGGGIYDYQKQQCDDFTNVVTIKIGKWIEVNIGQENYQLDLYMGEYRNGFKVGRWDILYKSYINNQFELIGGGFYDNEQRNHSNCVMDQIKIGRWIELSREFMGYNKMLCEGEYKNGKKTGQWIHFSSNNKVYIYSHQTIQLCNKL